MSILNAFREHILSDGAVTALLDSRFYPSGLPQAPQFPSVTYQLIDGVRRGTLRHEDNLPAKRIQVDVWSPSFDEAYEVAEAIREVFHYFQPGEIGDSPGVFVASVRLVNERADFEPDTSLHRVTRDYVITHAEGI